MVVSRIRQHVETHNWFAVTVDLAIVIVGVFLGAQANSWNERRIKHEQSISYRNRLVEELDFNARQFNQQLSYYEQVRNHALSAIAGLTAPSNSQNRDFLIDAYQSTQIDITPGKRFIYDEMVSSGLVDRLSNAKLQEEVSDYYLISAAVEATYNSVPPYRASMRSLIPHAAQAQIRKECGDIDVTHEGRVIGSRLPATCNVALAPHLIAASVENIRRDPHVYAELNRYVSWLNEKIESLKVSVKDTNKLRHHLIEQD
jgi:hypothetical protein